MRNEKLFRFPHFFPSLPMKEFISLREFLLLTEPRDKFHRPIHRNELLADSSNTLSNSQDLVRRYDIAKASWEKYGDEGPSFGSKVETLYAGHGGGPGVLAVLTGIYSHDEHDFLLTRQERYHDGRSWVEKEGTSLVERSYWWAMIRVIEESK